MLFERLDNNEIKFVVSDLLDLELLNAPTHVKELLHKYTSDKFERVDLIKEDKFRGLPTHSISDYQ